MKKNFSKLLNIVFVVVFVGKISNWFLNYTATINNILNTAMFSIIGLLFIAGGFLWKRKWVNALYIISGLYLIIMNFIPDFSGKSIIGIACLLTPIILTKFLPEDKSVKEVLNT